MTDNGFPRFRPVAEHSVLVEFGDRIDRQTHHQVRRLDSALASRPFRGFEEAVPAYTSLLVCFDPVRTNHATVQATLAALLNDDADVTEHVAVREVLVCYESEFAPDLPVVAERAGLTCEQVVAAHQAAEYRVYMYGFAPGYAYLAGVPELLQLPRKPSAVREVRAGSVLIAGPQCLVTTLTLATGWWIIGCSPTAILRIDDVTRPFMLDVGDTVRFRRVDRRTYDAERRRQ
jgi:inhibitor of KinA